jgi:hypothetical protein
LLLGLGFRAESVSMVVGARSGVHAQQCSPGGRQLPARCVGRRPVTGWRQNARGASAIPFADA